MEEKNCLNCKFLEREENRCPVAQKNYHCDIINSLVSTTRILIFKLEKIKKFYCSKYEKK